MSTSNEAWIGWILQDPVTLSHVAGGSQACVLASALQAELTACLHGVQMAVKRGYSRVLLCSDSSLLVGLLSWPQPCLVSVLWLVHHVCDVLHDLDWFFVRKVSRRLVYPAHIHILATSTCRRQLLCHRF